MRESDQKIHTISESSTFQLIFMKLNVLCIESVDISEFYSSLLVSSALYLTVLWRVGKWGQVEEILLSECVAFYLWSGQKHSFL